LAAQTKYPPTKMKYPHQTLLSANFTVFCFYIAFLFKSEAQVLQPAFQYSGQQLQTAGPMAALKNGQIINAGTFEGEVNWAGVFLENSGGADIFIAAFNPDQNAPEWILGGGSAEDDVISGLAVDSSDNMLVIGAAFGQFHLENLELLSDNSINPRFLFLIKINAQGEVMNGWTIQGNQDYAFTHVTSDYQGNWIVSGYFQGTLFFSDTSLVAQSSSDLFIAKFDADGNLLWALREGITGITRPVVIKADHWGNLMVAGAFNRSTSIAGVELEASSNDRDMFLAKYTSSGEGLWAIKAGGVLDDDVVDMEISRSGHIFAAGYFVGVLNPGNGIFLQTDDGDPDFFILKFDENGIPTGGISFGGTEFQLTRDIDAYNQQIVLTGLFQGTLTVDGQSWDSGQNYAGFVGLFSESLDFLYGVAITSDAGCAPSAAIFDHSGNIWITVSFAGVSIIGNTLLTATGDFDALLLKMHIQTGYHEQQNFVSWTITSNPVGDYIDLVGWEPGDIIYLMDLQSRLLGKRAHNGRISITHLPAGIYILICSRAEKKKVFRIVKGI
jgi:hypothetical protein